MKTTANNTKRIKITCFVGNNGEIPTRKNHFFVEPHNLDVWCEDKKNFLIDIYKFDDVRYTTAANGTLLMDCHREQKGRMKAKHVIFEISNPQ